MISKLSFNDCILQVKQSSDDSCLFQFTNEEAAFVAGMGITNKNQKAAILGSMSIAQVCSRLVTAKPWVDPTEQNSK
jgi:hypothetical protein